MSKSAAATRQDRIVQIVSSLLAQRQRPGKPGPDEDLREAGLTSLDMVKVVLTLEQEFAATIPEHAITPRNFRTITAIDQLMANLPSLQ